MLRLVLSNNTGYVVGVIIEAVLTVAAIILIILVMKFGLPSFEPRERKEKSKRTPKPGPERYTLRYSSGEGSGEAPALEQYTKGSKVLLKGNMFESPSGKRFEGWSDGERTYVAGQKYTMPEQSITLTAQWSEAERVYTLRYTAGSGSNEEDVTERYVKGATVVLKGNMFATPSGKTFEGWSDGENKYPSKFMLKMPEQSVTLTAQWKEPKREKEEAEVKQAEARQEEVKPVEVKQAEAIEVKVGERSGEVEQIDGGTTADGRPIIVNVYNTQGKSEKTVEKETIYEKEESDEGLEFGDYTILQLYELLSEEQKKYFDTLKDAAMSKPEAKLTVGRSFFNIKIGKRSIIKLRIRRLITVGEYTLENDILKDFRKASENKAGNAKIKVRPTIVAVTDGATLETALNMINLVHKQILEG